MKRTILLAAAWGCFSFAVRAQGDKEDVRIAMALLNKQKKAIISQSIPLDEALQKQLPLIAEKMADQ